MSCFSEASRTYGVSTTTARGRQPVGRHEPEAPRDTDPLGVTGWKHDANGLLTEQIDANGSRLGYANEAAQQLTALTMPNGESIGYEYGDAGRPVAAHRGRAQRPQHRGRAAPHQGLPADAG